MFQIFMSPAYTLLQHITYSFLLLDIKFKQVEGTLHFSFFSNKAQGSKTPMEGDGEGSWTLLPHRHRENFFVPSEMSDRRRQVSAVCLVCGSRRATSPAVRSRNDTSSIGTAQLVSTSFPKTMFPVIAATRPTPVKKPRAEELQDRGKKC